MGRRKTMELTKRTFALPPATVSRFEREVESGDRDEIVARLLEQYLETQRRAALREDIAEGCKQMWDIYRDTAREWEGEDDRLLRSVSYST
jgi:hypothetical protein